MLTIYNVFTFFEDGSSDFDNQYETYEQALKSTEQIFKSKDVEEVLICKDYINAYSKIHECWISGRSTQKSYRIKNPNLKD